MAWYAPYFLDRRELIAITTIIRSKIAEGSIQLKSTPPRARREAPRLGRRGSHGLPRQYLHVNTCFYEVFQTCPEGAPDVRLYRGTTPTLRANH